MTIDDYYQWVNFIANKKQSGAISPNEFNQIIKAVSLDFFKLKVGLPEEYQVGNPIPRQVYQITQKISDDITHLLVTAEITKNTSTSGVNYLDYFTLPKSAAPYYGAFSKLRYRYVTNGKNCSGAVAKEIPIEIVTDEELNSRMSSDLLPPTAKRPLANFEAYGLNVFPDTINKVKLSYLRLPNVPFRNYVIVDDEDVYSPLGVGAVYPNVPSVSFDFPDTCFNDICIRIVQYYGINISSGDLLGMINERKQTGQ